MTFPSRGRAKFFKPPESLDLQGFQRTQHHLSLVIDNALWAKTWNHFSPPNQRTTGADSRHDCAHSRDHRHIIDIRHLTHSKKSFDCMCRIHHGRSSTKHKRENALGAHPPHLTNPASRKQCCKTDMPHSIHPRFRYDEGTDAEVIHKQSRTHQFSSCHDQEKRHYPGPRKRDPFV